MKTKILLSFLVFLALSNGQSCDGCEAQEVSYDDDDYYKTAYKCIKKRDLECLKKEISLIITNNAKVLNECCLLDILSDTDHDDDDKEKVVMLFTEETKPKSERGNQTGQWGKHQLWPENRGAKSAAAMADIHQIRPCDNQVSSLRGGKDFKEGGTSSICLEPYGGPISECEVSTNYSDTTFNVPEDQKGDVARMLFYMVYRYPDLNLSLEDVTSGSTQLGWKTDLLKWTTEDEVDDFEKKRNERIHKYQLNRNPFIDHPEWIKYIYIDNQIPEQPGLTTAGIILIVVIGVLHLISLALCFLQSLKNKEKTGGLLSG